MQTVYCRMVGWIGKECKGNNHGLIKVLSQHQNGKTEVNVLTSHQLMSQPRFKPNTNLMQYSYAIWLCVMPHSLACYRLVKGTCCFHLQGRSWRQELPPKHFLTVHQTMRILTVLSFVFIDLSNIRNAELTNQSVFRSYSFIQMMEADFWHRLSYQLH